MKNEIPHIGPDDVLEHNSSKASKYRLLLSSVLAGVLTVGCAPKKAERPHPKTVQQVPIRVKESTPPKPETLDIGNLPELQELEITLDSKNVVPMTPGSYVLVGDSITEHITEKTHGILNSSGRIMEIAKGGSTLEAWGIRRNGKPAPNTFKIIRRHVKNGELAGIENAVVNFGMNDIGLGMPAEKIFENLKKMWSTLQGDFDYDGTKDYDGVGKIYAVTVSPIGNLEGYADRPAVHKRREQLNQLILNSDIPYHTIDLTKTESEGGLADDQHPSQLSPSAFLPHRDWCHPNQNMVASIYQRELEYRAGLDFLLGLDIIEPQ